MKFLADENFPGPSIAFLREGDINIRSIGEEQPGLLDEQVIKWAITENRTILTHDSDYGELIFKFGFKPKAGVIYFRIDNFGPVDPAIILLDLVDQEMNFSERLTVINENSIRQRLYSLER